MTIEILKETIVSQALEIQELKKEVKTLENNLVYARLYSDKKIDEKLEIKEHNRHLANQNADLRKYLKEASDKLKSKTPKQNEIKPNEEVSGN